MDGEERRFVVDERVEGDGGERAGAVRCQTRRRVSGFAEPLHPRTRLAAHSAYTQRQ